MFQALTFLLCSLPSPPVGQAVLYRPQLLEDTAEWSNGDPLAWESGQDLKARVVKAHADGTADVMVLDVNGVWHSRLKVRWLSEFDIYFSDGGNGLLPAK